MADINTLSGKVPENNVDSLYDEIDNTLAPIPEVPSTITESSIHNTESPNLGEHREIDNYLLIDKNEKINISNLDEMKESLKPVAEFTVSHFPDKRFISKELSDLNDERLKHDIDNEVSRSYQADIILAEAINLEDEQREIADAQIKADIAKEALERANTDADLANALAKYKYAMSQHITTRELDVNGDARINIEVKDGDEHGGNLYVEKDIYTEDDFGTTKKYRDVIGTIKNALVKDFTQTYDPNTGKLTSKLEFQNYHTDNDERPTVETIEKTIDLDLEKFIVDINDVYAIKNEDGTYTDQVDLTDDQLAEIDSPTYNGNIKRYLKVAYNVRNNDATFEEGGSKAGTEKQYVYYEVNDIFRSIISMIAKNTHTVYLKDAENNIIGSFKTFAPEEGTADQIIDMSTTSNGDTVVFHTIKSIS